MIKYPLVSILMPVYNVEAYLSKAIESVLDSTYRNFEFFIVDDASTDGCKSIIEKYTKQDNRIIPIYLSHNSGTCNYPRNVALLQSHGDYITWVDSDDEILSFTIEEFVDILQKEDADYITGLFETCATYHPSSTYKVYEDAFDKMGGRCTNTVINSMMTRELAMKTMLEENLLFEDSYISTMGWLYCKKYIDYDKTTYLYNRHRKDSICHSSGRKGTQDRDRCMKLALENIQKVYGNKYDFRFKKFFSR